MAAMLTGAPLAVVGKLGDVDTSARMPLGTRVRGVDDFGNSAEFIYLKGVGSTIVGSVVTYDETGATALIAANAKGPVAVAMAITDATTEYGWYCIQGTVYVDMVANSADNATLGRETSDGKVGDGRSAGDQIANCFARGATTAAALQYAQIDHPYVDDFQGA